MILEITIPEDASYEEVEYEDEEDALDMPLRLISKNPDWPLKLEWVHWSRSLHGPDPSKAGDYEATIDNHGEFQFQTFFVEKDTDGRYWTEIDYDD